MSLLVLLLLAIFTALIVTLLRSGLPEFDWAGFALALLFTCWATLICAGVLCRLSDWLDTRTAFTAAAFTLLLVLMVVALLTVLAQWWAQGSYAGSGIWSVSWPGVAEHVLIASILTGIALRYAAVNRELRLREQSELTARLEALQARIKPHFLFNSLNSIASLIHQAPADAEQAVLDLAALFRAGLSQRETLVCWRQERTLCEQYLRIEQLRLGDRLQVEWRTQWLDEDLKLPALSVQPLLENAILHGIQRSAEPAVLSIEAIDEGGCVVLRISNPLPAASESTREEGNNMAVENIRHRLHACFGERAGLDLGVDGDCYVASLRLPQGGQGA